MTVRPMLGLLPVVTFALATYAMIPVPRRRDVRLAAIRAAVLVAGVAVGGVELLSAGRWLAFPQVVGLWSTATGIATGFAYLRWRRSHGGLADLARRARRAKRRVPGLAERARRRVFCLGRVELALLVAMVGLLLAELVLALCSAPNTFDSQTYHLPRIEHWITNRGVGPYPTAIHRQVTYPPGGEYLLLHLRLLTGGDAGYAMVQWSAGLLCLLAITRLTAQLGGGRRAQLLAAFVFATAPATVLEASSTQVDLVAAAWVTAAATMAVDRCLPGAGRSGPGRASAVEIGLACGLVTVTKSPAMVVVAALLCWALAAEPAAAIRSGGRSPAAWVPAVLRRAGSTAVIIAVTVGLAGPFLWRTDTEFGNPLGPDYLRQSISLERHDPAAVLVNGLRQAHSMFDTPVAPLRQATAGAVEVVADGLGVDPSDPKITFNSMSFPQPTWYPSEGCAAIPVQALLLVVGWLVVLVRPGRSAAGRRAYLAVVGLGVVVHASTVKWSPWGNRLTLYLIALASPAVGLWLAPSLARLGRMVRQRPAARLDRVAGLRRIAAAALATVLLAGATAGWLSAAYGWPRRLVGGDSVFVLSRWQTRFVLRPSWSQDYTAAADAIRAAGAQRIGVVQGNDSWEYPLWLLLPGRELVAMQSQSPKHPPVGVDGLDAVVCQATRDVCGWYIPTDWTIVDRAVLTYALQPKVRQ